MATNKQVHLVKYAEHEASEDCFQTNTAKLAPLKPGQVLIRVHYLSIDPYLRGLMNAEGSFAPATKLGDVMPGGGVGEVVESKNSSFSVGDFVTGEFGWQQFAVCSGSGARGSDGSILRKVDARKIKPSLYLGAAGMPGVTAWYGVNEILRVKSGETLVVSAASGAVGSVVTQLAKLKGCHVIGVAGGKAKCDYVVKELGADACIDYKQFKSGDKVAQIADAIKAAAPGGVDCYFENVGGDVGNAILRCMNLRGRVAVCGLIAGYEGHPNPITDPSLILAKRLVIQGMLVGDAGDELWTTAIDELSQMLHDGKLKFRETVLDGLESAPSGLIGVLHGKNFGKMVVRLEGAPAEVGERRRA